VNIEFAGVSGKADRPLQAREIGKVLSHREAPFAAAEKERSCEIEKIRG
jgi:hypothetical protein